MSQHRIISIMLVVFGLASSGEADGPKPQVVAAPQRQEFSIDNRPAFILMPPEKKSGPTPWVFYAPTLGTGLPGDAEQWMFRQFLAAGIAIAGVDVGESYGSPQGRVTYSALHQALVEQHGFDPKACLLARSRGGLMLYAWAEDNPDKVRCIAGIYPVSNLASYPGIARACGAYGMTEQQLTAKLAEHNPVDRLAPLARSHIPIFHIHGDDDHVVPMRDNSGLLAERYRSLGGQMELVVARGQGHNMWQGFFTCQELVDFVIGHAAHAVPAPVAHWSLDDGGTTAVDSAGQHHGEIHGATSVEGQIGRALRFDRGQGQYVSIPYSKDFDVNTFTVSAWVKLTKEPTFSGILGTRFGSEYTFDMKVNAEKVHGDIGDGDRWIETKVNFYEKDTGSNRQGGKLRTNQWYHITYVIDDNAKNCRLYLDGDMKAQISYRGTARLMKPDQTMHIGHSSGTEYMDGIIDDLQIWNQALTDLQVRSLVGRR
jgi:Concanavalin A-like lectin/glucanases superfamily/Prolyl oligopeptidase family